MKHLPIGTKTTKSSRTPAADRHRKRHINQAGTASGPLDVFPVKIRYNAPKPRGTQVWRDARLIITDGPDAALYVATTTDKGNTVQEVKKFPIPSGERTASASQKGTYGNFGWEGCGCFSQWKRHSRDSLIARASG